ncbi:MAG: UDP-3-O-acyl-N-acetylglucosamine deacetylase, partial [Bacteroidota bacterium]
MSDIQAVAVKETAAGSRSSGVVRQTTICSSVSISGVGLHTGALVTLTFHPAEENHGYR